MESAFNLISRRDLKKDPYSPNKIKYEYCSLQYF